MAALLLALLALLLAAPASPQPPAAPPSPAIIGYVFPQERRLGPAEIDAAKLTHVNYAFANVRDGRVVDGFARDTENLRVLTGLRAAHPRLRILVSIGGWTWSKGFSDLALTPEGRRRFCDSALDYLRRHDLDGLDVDWEYPGLPGDGNPHRPEDAANFTLLMAELRAQLDRESGRTGRRYWLTLAAGAFPDFLAHTEMEKVQDVVDYVNLMTYDFLVPGAGPLAGHHANLLPHPSASQPLSARGAVEDFLAAGVPARKLVVGVPFYGRAWEVEGEYGPLYQPGKPPASFPGTSYGALRDLPGRDGWLRLWDDAAQAPWLWNPARRLFVSYEDPRSLRLKCRLVRERGLGGVMFWEYSADSEGELLGTLYEELRAPARGAKAWSSSKWLSPGSWSPVSRPDTTRGSKPGPTRKAVVAAPARSAPSRHAPSSARTTVVPTATTRPRHRRAPSTAATVSGGTSDSSGNGSAASSAGAPVDDSPAAWVTLATATPPLRSARSSEMRSTRPAEGISAASAPPSTRGPPSPGGTAPAG